jgi:23S rRNA (uracil1939-C5)-methyltransferase
LAEFLTLAEAAKRIAAKDLSPVELLQDCLARIGGVRPDVIFPAIHGPAWEYRYRARLSVRNVVKKGGVLVGFHERRSSFVADMSECRVLPQRISDLLVPLRELIGSLSVRDRLPQIELAIGDGVDVLVLRLLDPLSAADTVALRQFAARRRIALALQPKGPETVAPFHPDPWPELDYSLPEFDLRLRFSPPSTGPAPGPARRQRSVRVSAGPTRGALLW